MSLAEDRLPEIIKKFERQVFESFHGRLKQFVDAAPDIKSSPETIAAMQFAATYKSGGTEYDVLTLTIADDHYQKILESFFKERGSILFSNDKKIRQEWYTPVNGRACTIRDRTAKPHRTAALSKATSCGHQDWIDTLEKNHFGRYSIWLTVNGLPEDKWDFSLDFFIVLNVNLAPYMPSDIRSTAQEELVKKTFKHDLFRILYSFMEVAGPAVISNALLDNVRLKSMKAAISQVMARNMSHNLGSHVLNNLTDAYALNNENATSEKPYHSSVIANNYKPDDPEDVIKQLAIFNNYVKCRMDYLGDVTFGLPTMQSNIKVYETLFKDLDKVRYLLNNISGLADSFHYELEFRHNGQLLSEEMDTYVAMPNDILGAQAFYNILENVIRNTAKHNQRKDSTRITRFTINFLDNVEIDNTIPWNDSWGFRAAATSLYQVEIYDNLPSDDETVQNQNEKIKESPLDKEFQLRTQSLGMIEMAASAAYLRKLDVVSIADEEFLVSNDLRPYTYNPTNSSAPQLNILKAFNKSGSLGYRFYMLKPAEYLFIGFDTVDRKRRDELRKWGILLISRADFLKEIATTIYNHQFVFYFSNDEVEQKFLDHPTHLSLRKIKLTEKPAHALLQNAIGQEVFKFPELELFVWNTWFEENKGPWQDVQVTGNKNDVKANHYNIIYLNHFQRWEAEWESYQNSVTQHLEPLSSEAQRLLPNYSRGLVGYFNLDTTKSNAIRVRDYKLYEASTSRILVIDERIQRYAKTTYNAEGLKVPFYDIYKASRVTIPESTEAKLDVENFDDTMVAITVDYINATHTQHDFLLIHYSLMERMFKNDLDIISKKLITWSLGTRVIVTSGRGKPKALPKDVCYLNLSPVIKVFTQTRNKYAIFNLLNQARRL